MRHVSRSFKKFYRPIGGLEIVAPTNDSVYVTGNDMRLGFVSWFREKMFYSTSWKPFMAYLKYARCPTAAGIIERAHRYEITIITPRHFPQVDSTYERIL